MMFKKLQTVCQKKKKTTNREEKYANPMCLHCLAIVNGKIE
jgi:hypothetical protein